jgi:uncharacterized phage infection (PIP) family protein YhgE
MFLIRLVLILLVSSVARLAFAEETTTAPNTKPWVELEARVTELQGKIKAKEDELKKLIEAKKFLPDGSKELAEMGKSIQAEHKALSGLIEEYDRARNQLRFRFPERMADESKFNKMQLQTVPQIEESMGIESKMNRNLEKMRRQYPSGKTPEESSAQVKRNGKSPSTTVPSRPIDQEGSIVIKK